MGERQANMRSQVTGKRSASLAKCLLLAFGGLGLTAAPAAATVLDYNLTDYVGSGAPSLSSPYGTVALNDNGGSNVTVTVTLAAAVGFVNTGAGYSLTWDLNNTPIITVPSSSITPGFSLVSSSPGTLSAGASGTWDYAISCSINTCGHGGQSPYTSPLSFTIDNVALTDFIANGSGYEFSADVCLGVSGGTCSGGITGVVVANMVPTTGQSGEPVPEPASVIYFGTALGALTFLRRRWLHG
jgi:hypothetical protein